MDNKCQRRELIDKDVYQYRDKLIEINGYQFYGVEITKYTGEGQRDGILEIPSFIDGKPVISIGKSAFRSRLDLRCEIKLPETLLSIGTSAFYDCSGLVGTLTIPSSVMEIKSFAFNFCIGLNVINLTNIRNNIHLGDICESGNYLYLDIFWGCSPKKLLVNSNTPVGVLRKFFIDKIYDGSTVRARTTFKPDEVVVLD